jgi:hypothetical protein
MPADAHQALKSVINVKTGTTSKLPVIVIIKGNRTIPIPVVIWLKIKEPDPAAEGTPAVMAINVRIRIFKTSENRN